MASALVLILPVSPAVIGYLLCCPTTSSPAVHAIVSLSLPVNIAVPVSVVGLNLKPKLPLGGLELFSISLPLSPSIVATMTLGSRPVDIVFPAEFTPVPL